MFWIPELYFSKVEFPLKENVEKPRMNEPRAVIEDAEQRSASVISQRPFQSG